ncbi:GTP-binding protein [Bacillus sp. 1P06AnD]|uniref:GTP-binding protein n=1 Tax=Bacillus sp. 1P06AnD TaxID=3132208 RepID=UPI0039A374B6
MTPIKNIGILAHVDAGKTTVTERLLFEAGAIASAGDVDEGNTVTDSMELERKRGITIRSSTTSFYWKDQKINIIDTPGHMDFFAEVERVFGILDAAVLVISAKEGVQSQTRIIFQQLKRMKIPVLLFINKIDRNGVELEPLYGQIKVELDDRLAIMQKVIHGGTSTPAILDEAPMADDILHCLFERDEMLAGKFLNDQPISEDEYKQSFLATVQSGDVFPVFHGAAAKGIGIPSLLDAIDRLLPSYKIPSLDTLSGYVYKIDRDAKWGKTAYIKLFSGCLSIRQNVDISNKNRAGFKIRQLFKLENSSFHPAEKVDCGDIAILPNADPLSIGDILGAPFRAMPVVSREKPTLQVSLQPIVSGDRSKLIQAIYELTEEDPLLQCSILQETNEITIHIYGKVQIEIIQSLLKERYGLEALFGSLLTIYKECPTQAGEAIINMGVKPNPYYASIGLRIEPLPIGAGIEYESLVSYGYLNSSFQNAVQQGVEKACRSGLNGIELTDAKITFFYAQYASPVSTPSDFRHLAPYVMEAAIRKSGTELLEPLCSFHMEIPADCGGRAIHDVLEMGGTIQNMSPIVSRMAISGIIPADTSREYAAEVIAYTEGKGLFLTEPAGYGKLDRDLGDFPTAYSSEPDRLRYLFLKAEREEEAKRGGNQE